jgi:hypothetical protein
LIDKSRGGSLAYGDANVNFTNIDNIYGGNKKRHHYGKYG